MVGIFKGILGSSVCEESNCEYDHVICKETLNGVSVICTSPCKHGMCFNNAECKHEQRTDEPVCMCPSTTAVWYMGEYCQTMISDWMVILGFVLCGLLVIIVIFLSVLVCKYRTSGLKRQKSSEHFFFTHNGSRNDEHSKDILRNGIKLSEMNKAYNDHTQSRHKTSDHQGKSGTEYRVHSDRYRNRSGRKRIYNHTRKVQVKRRNIRSYSSSDSSSKYLKRVTTRMRRRSFSSSSVGSRNNEFTFAQKLTTGQNPLEVDDTFDTTEFETTESTASNRQIPIVPESSLHPNTQKTKTSYESSDTLKTPSLIRWLPIDNSFSASTSHLSAETDTKTSLTWRKPSYNLQVYDNSWEADV